MSEFDPLRTVLREWQAPEPSAALDARVVAGYRKAMAPLSWRRLWTARVNVPVPVLAAAVLLVMALLFVNRPNSPIERTQGVVTRLEATGFQPLPDGAARVVPVQEIKQ